MKKKTKQGGKRLGAGRPKTKEDTKVMRVPLSLVEKFEAMILKYHSGYVSSSFTITPYNGSRGALL